MPKSNQAATEVGGGSTNIIAVVTAGAGFLALLAFILAYLTYRSKKTSKQQDLVEKPFSLAPEGLNTKYGQENVPISSPLNNADYKTFLTCSSVQPSTDTSWPKETSFAKFFIEDEQGGYESNEGSYLCPDFETPIPFASGSLQVSAHFDSREGQLCITIHEANGLSAANERGYNQIRLTLLPDRREKFKTKVGTGSRFEYNETFIFSDVSEDTMRASCVRFRVYSDHAQRKAVLAGECFLNLDQLVVGDCSRMDRISLAIYPPLLEVQGPDSSCASFMAGTTADHAADLESINVTTLPEILVGLMYSRSAGKLVVSVLKATSLALQYTKCPDTFVKVCLLSPYGDEIGKRKTAIKKCTANPLYDETFVFQVPDREIEYVTLMITVYCMLGMLRRQVVLGCVTLGQHNCGSNEAAHWAEACIGDADEAKIARWHTLTE